MNKHFDFFQAAADAVIFFNRSPAMPDGRSHQKMP